MKTTEIDKYSPCNGGLEFRNQFETFKEAWEACPRGDWMLWLAKKAGVDLLKLTTAKALCANTVRHLMKDEHSTNAIDVALRFGRGEATKEELKAADAAAYAAYAAYAAAYAAYAAAYAAAAAADAAAYAAYAAAYAAYAAAYAAAAAAADAADAAAAAAAADAADAAAADAAAYAAAADAAAAAADARTKNRMETADICRRVLTEEVYRLLEIS